MYLYHYSDKLFDRLLTKRKQGIKDDANKLEKYAYLDHISFFLEPIPLDILPSIHKNKHPFYVEGKELNEYKILTTSLGKMFYRLVESPENIKLLYDTTIDDETYYKERDKVDKKNKYEGTSLKDLESLVHRFQGTTREYFKKIPSYPNYEEIKTKYAPCVPHFMIYPETGIVNYSECNKVTLGKNRKIAKEDHIPLISKW